MSQVKYVSKQLMTLSAARELIAFLNGAILANHPIKEGGIAWVNLYNKAREENPEVQEHLMELLNQL